ncbi:MAG TPA: alpha/beta hydrolase [Pseudonocardiaceae bacterium]|jgi:pimeloyl-ACP methyl ester carboxylesterase|nr:alpha/beta hydrolase [Pseudonocardiaceae bacterium]
MTYVLVHGASSDSAYWQLLTPELRARGQDVVTMDLPVADDSAGLAEYADTIVEAIGDRTGIVLVAQSMAGFSAPLVCDRLRVDLLVLLNAMVPAPGESPGDWWANTGQAAARAELAVRQGRDPKAPFDPMVDFLHDLPPELVTEMMSSPPIGQSDTPFVLPWPLSSWPDVPTRFLQGREDRFFPLEFQRRVLRDRLGLELDELPGGHLAALSHPRELAARLESYRTQLTAD